jgi:hypothetical protein
VFCDGFFSTQGLLSYLSLLTAILLISASWVARIIGVSHPRPAYLFIIAVLRIEPRAW